MAGVLQIEADVPESRQVTITLPREVRPGRVRLTVTMGPAPDAPVPGWPYYRPADPAVAAEYDAFWCLFPTLLASHKGRYVAVYQGRVIDTGDDLGSVSRRVRALHGGAPVYVARVCDGSEMVRVGGIRVGPEETAS